MSEPIAPDASPNPGVPASGPPGGSAPGPVPRPTPRPAGGGRIVLALVLFTVFLFVGSGGLLWWATSRQDTGTVGDGSWLHVRLSGELVDAPAEPGPFDPPDAIDPTATELARAIRMSAHDDRIEGLYLDIGPVGGGLTLFEEIREAVDDFRAAGKPCVAYAESAIDNASYMLASGCDTVVMHPTGVAVVDGMRLAVTYYRDTLDQLGIVPEIEHVGDYKSAVEPFERTGPSDAAAEAYEGMLDALYEELVGRIAEGRGLAPEQVRAWIDDPVMDPQSLLMRGQIDGLAYPRTVKARVHRVPEEGVAVLEGHLGPDEDEAKLTKVSEVLKGLRAKGASGPGIAVVHASGSIMPGNDQPSLFGDDGTLTDGELVGMLEEVLEDDAVKAVVLRVDSPGGSALASMNMRDAILRVQDAGKPVVISMARYAASGGYLISADADWIVAQPTTITGSIGVFGTRFAMDGLWEKMGMHVHAFQRGEEAGLLAATAYTDAQRETFRGYIAFFYEEFVSLVAQGRSMEPSAVEEHAQGRVWTGRQALDRGLVDEIGGLEVAIDKARDLGGLVEAQEAVYQWPRRKTFFERLIEEFEGGASARLDLGAAAAQAVVDSLPAGVQAELATLEAVAGQGPAVFAWLPGAPRAQ